jgi:hypothetical protein
MNEIFRGIKGGFSPNDLESVNQPIRIQLAEYSDLPKPLQTYAAKNERSPSNNACSLPPIHSDQQLSNILGERKQKSKVARKVKKGNPSECKKCAQRQLIASTYQKGIQKGKKNKKTLTKSPPKKKDHSQLSQRRIDETINNPINASLSMENGNPTKERIKRAVSNYLNDLLAETKFFEGLFTEEVLQNLEQGS